MIDFSFVIGVYNPPESAFRRCLDSCLSQKGIRYEIVAVNDGSTNNALDILSEYDRKYPGIFKIINQQNHGNGPSRANGFECSIGKYIWFIDQDDVVRSNCVKELLDAMEEHDADQLVFGAKRCLPENIKGAFPPIRGQVFKECSRDFLFAGRYWAYWKRIVRRDLVCKVGLDSPFSIQDDVPIATRWILESKKSIHVNGCYYLWVQHSQSVTHYKYFSPSLMRSSVKSLQLQQECIDAYPEYRKWICFNIVVIARANLKRIEQSRKCKEARALDIQKEFEELKSEYTKWLNRYSPEDLIYVTFYDYGRVKPLAEIRDLRKEMTRLKNAKFEWIMKPMRTVSKYLRRILGMS